MMCCGAHKKKKYIKLNNRVDYVFDLFPDGRFWIENGKDTVAEKVKYVNRLGVAKNVIMFLGDGMSLTTLTAARIYKGQLAKRSGESEYLSFEKFPYVGMAKVRCARMVTESGYRTRVTLIGRSVFSGIRLSPRLFCGS